MTLYALQPCMVGYYVHGRVWKRCHFIFCYDPSWCSQGDFAYVTKSWFDWYLPSCILLYEFASKINHSSRGRKSRKPPALTQNHEKMQIRFIIIYESPFLHLFRDFEFYGRLLRNFLKPQSLLVKWSCGLSWSEDWYGYRVHGSIPSWCAGGSVPNVLAVNRVGKAPWSSCNALHRD